MSSFKPGGSAAAFARSGNDGRKFEAKPEDRLITVTGYDTEKAVMFGTDERGKPVSVVISFEAIDRNRKHEKAEASFHGHLIDEKMKAKIPVGNFIIAERCVGGGFAKKENGGGVMLKASRIINCTTQDKDKTFRGLFTVSERGGQVVSVQHWEGTSTQSPAGILPRLQAVVDEAAAGTHPVSIGFMLRALAKDGAGYTCVNSSAPFDYVRAEKDEEGNELSPGGHITPQYFIQVCKDYRKYLEDTGVVFDEIDMMVYRNFKVSSHSKSFDVSREFAIKRMVEKGVILCPGEEPFTGKTWAVSGIIQITEDEVRKEGKNFIAVPRNLVKSLHANGPMGDVRNWVRGPKGEKVQTADNLKPVYTPREDVPAAVAMDSIVQAAQVLEDKAQEAKDAVLDIFRGVSEDDDDFKLFDGD